MENNLTIIDMSIIKVRYVYKNHGAVHLKHCKCFVFAFVSTHKIYILREKKEAQRKMNVSQFI